MPPHISYQSIWACLIISLVAIVPCQKLLNSDDHMICQLSEHFDCKPVLLFPIDVYSFCLVCAFLHSSTFLYALVHYGIETKVLEDDQNKKN
jgi:hypothetical protein